MDAHVSGPESWLCDWERLPLLQRTRVPGPELTLNGSQPLRTRAPGGPAPSSALHRRPHSHIPTCRHTHVHKFLKRNRACKCGVDRDHHRRGSLGSQKELLNFLTFFILSFFFFKVRYETKNPLRPQRYARGQTASCAVVSISLALQAGSQAPCVSRYL